MEKIELNENQSVFKVGELPDKMYLLVRGSIEIFYQLMKPKRQILLFKKMNYLVKWVLLKMSSDWPQQDA